MFCRIPPLLLHLKLARGLPWRRRWHPTPVLLPGKSHGWRSLIVCSPWGREESDVTERLPFHFHFHALEKEMATHSSTLAWRIPGTGSLVGCRLWGRTELDTTEATEQQQQQPLWGQFQLSPRASGSAVRFHSYDPSHRPSTSLHLPWV